MVRPGQSEWVMRQMARSKEKKRAAVWIVIHIVGSCDVNSTDSATLLTLLPINLLKWISNATLGASTDLKLLSQTHQNKTYYFYQFPWFVGKVSSGDGWDVQDKQKSYGQKSHIFFLLLVLSLFSLHKCTHTGFMVNIIFFAIQLFAIQDTCCRGLGTDVVYTFPVWCWS